MSASNSLVGAPQKLEAVSLLPPYSDAHTLAEVNGENKPFILVVEDNPADALLIEEALREHRIECDLTVIGDGEEAMQLFQALASDPNALSPNLVLLDLNLPKRSGHEILGYIRQNERSHTTPVIIVTSSQDKTELARVRRLGATAHFHKPSSFVEFLKLGALVRDLL